MLDSNEGRLEPLTYSEGGREDQREQAMAQVCHALTLGLPQIQPVPPHDKKALIVACGPSSVAMKEDIIEKKRAGAAVFAVNEAHNWLIEIGHPPDAVCLFEIDIDTQVLFTKLDKRVAYLCASHCNPKNFEALKGYDVAIWHALQDFPGWEESIALFGRVPMIAGGSTTMLRLLSLVIVLGYQDIELYGCESSYEGEKSHAIGESEALGISPVVEIVGIAPSLDGSRLESRSFKTRTYLARQADQFMLFCEKQHRLFKLRAHGDGLLPWTHRRRYPEQYHADKAARDAEFYDVASRNERHDDAGENAALFR